MLMHNLLPCPFCGGAVSIAEKAYGKEQIMFITRGIGTTKKNCNCRVFMESDPYPKKDCDAKDKARNGLVEAWNKRVSGGETVCSAYAEAIAKIVRRKMNNDPHT